MADYYIDNINLLISQMKLGEVLKLQDKVFVDENDLTFIKKVLYGNYFRFRIENFHNGSYCFTIQEKITEVIFQNEDAMKNFLTANRDGYKNLVKNFKNGELTFPSKDLFIDRLNQLDNSDYLHSVKEYLSFFNPKILEEHESSFNEIIKSVD